MKKLIYISSIILLAAGCKNIVQNKFPAQKVLINDMVAPATAEESEVKADTLILTSRPFTLNNLLCYWKHSFLIYDYGGLDIEAKLYDYKTKRILLEYEESPKHPEYYYDYKSETYFDSINKNYFDDFNFDGFKDFTIYYNGSMAMTSTTAIYLFNNENKTFERSDLSDTSIEKIDTINRILQTSSWDMNYQFERKHHFDSNGKLIFSEQFTYANDTTEIVHYKKTIDGKIVEQKTNTRKE